MDPGSGKRRAVLASLAVLTVVGAVVLVADRRKGAAPDPSDQEDSPMGRHEASPEGAPPSLLTPPSAEQVDQRVRAAVAEWRTGILQRNATTVMKIDALFLETPDMYVEGLKQSAATDENERVRAFSTRELGKFKRVELAATFTRLLDDKSPFVRKNAAWALGELGVHDGGRAAARQAEVDLRRLARRDPADDVRDAARDALRRIE